MAVRQFTLDRKYLESIGIISVDIDNKTVDRYNMRSTKVITTSATRSLQNNGKDGDVDYINYIMCIRGKTYSFSNIVYAWYVGPIPKGFLIDHINGKTSDNSLSNLRIYTAGQNKINNYKRMGR